MNTFKQLKQDHDSQKHSNYFVTVKEDKDTGYWEIDYIKQTANFRYFLNQPLPKNIEIDNTEYNTIIDFISDTDFPNIKNIMGGKKLIFSSKTFCYVSSCDQIAFIKEANGKKSCMKHFKI